ncbi:hypothetical protein ABEG63_12825 [Chryseobacterium sp. C39-AII1]|uniref:hypothetical protein n=1 Tax=Chryseobacterium sp. C39-AII1 TaxID=3080332 RepID=UPI003209DBCB
MKKILLSLFVTSTLGLCAQGKLNIFNYSSYRLSNYLVGSNQANNCYPNVSGTNYPLLVPPNTNISYDSYSTSNLTNPPINSWTVQLNASSGTLPPQIPGASPLLNVLGTTTKWQMNKFYVEDPSGAPLYYSGASIGNIDCNVTITDLIPSAATPYPFSAFWFDVGNDTYFVIQ